jgi:hypothetical protein
MAATPRRHFAAASCPIIAWLYAFAAAIADYYGHFADAASDAAPPYRRYMPRHVQRC